MHIGECGPSYPINAQIILFKTRRFFSKKQKHHYLCAKPKKPTRLEICTNVKNPHLKDARVLHEASTCGFAFAAPAVLAEYVYLQVSGAGARHSALSAARRA